MNSATFNDDEALTSPVAEPSSENSFPPALPSETAIGSSLFALRLGADLLTGLVVTGVLSKQAANALLDDGLASLLETYPEFEDQFRDIAGTLSAQIGLVSLDLERKQDRD